MDQQEQKSNALKDNNEFGESSRSPSSTNPTHCSFNNLDASQSVLEHRGLIRGINDPGKYLNFQRMLIDQRNTAMALKMSEYEKALAEKDYTIQSLHTDMMNSQNNNYALTSHCMNLMEKTKSENVACQRLNTRFSNICDCINNFGNSVDNVRTKQHDVMNLIDQTTDTFKEKILNISNNIDDILKQVSIEKMRAQQELEILESKYSLDMISYNYNLEEYAKEINNLKTENNFLIDKLNETTIRLNEEKELILNKNQNYEKDLKEMEGQNVLLISQNKSLNVKYEEILSENQSLKNEITTIKNSLDENKKQLDMQSAVVKEQIESLKNLKSSEELNDALKKDNFSLKEHNEYLEKNNASLVEDISKIKLFYKDIQEKKENKFKEMCKNYDDLLKMQEEKLVEIAEQLQLKNEKEDKTQAELSHLKQVVDVSNNTIINLQEELKTNYILVPELQNKINDLSTNLANAHQKLQDSKQENITKIHKLNNEKIELENQRKEHLIQTEKLTANYVKYKSKTMQLHEEIRKLQLQCLQSKQKDTLQENPILEIIEIASDEDVKTEDDDCSIVEFNDKDITNMNVSIHSIRTSNKRNKINPKINYSSAKRNSSPLIQVKNSKVKKLKTSVDNISSQVNNEFNLDSLNKESILTPVKEKYDVNNESKDQVQLTSKNGKKKRNKRTTYVKPSQATGK